MLSSKTPRAEQCWKQDLVLISQSRTGLIEDNICLYFKSFLYSFKYHNDEISFHVFALMKMNINFIILKSFSDLSLSLCWHRIQCGVRDPPSSSLESTWLVSMLLTHRDKILYESHMKSVTEAAACVCSLVLSVFTNVVTTLSVPTSAIDLHTCCPLWGGTTVRHVLFDILSFLFNLHFFCFFVFAQW